MLGAQVLDSFFDELTKIANGVESMPIQSAGPSDLVVTTTTDPLNSWEKNPSWEESSPRRLANKFFGKRRPSDGTLKAKFDQGSTAAQSPDRSQSPIDAQSTANVSAGAMMNPAYGPGGV